MYYVVTCQTNSVIRNGDGYGDIVVEGVEVKYEKTKTQNFRTALSKMLSELC